HSNHTKKQCHAVSRAAQVKIRGFITRSPISLQKLPSTSTPPLNTVYSPPRAYHCVFTALPIPKHRFVYLIAPVLLCPSCWLKSIITLAKLGQLSSLFIT